MGQGKRVRNTLVIYLRHEHNPPKGGIILDGLLSTQVLRSKAQAVGEEPMAYQLVGSVKDYQGYDG